MANPLLPDDFRELLCEFNRGKVEYLLIGGYAVGCHGHPRATNDMDLWINATAGNSRRAVAALTRFGFHEFSDDPLFFSRPKALARLGRVPFQVDLLNHPIGVGFDAAYERRAKIKVDGIVIPVIGLGDLIRAKRATGRPQDLADADRLEKLRRAGPKA